MASKKYWYLEGVERGKSIAEVNKYEVRSLLEKDNEEKAYELLYECEETDRQFSPFEFTAQELNNAVDPDGYWESFNNGIRVGLGKTVKTIKKELI